MTATLSNPLAFALGIGLALLPSYAPFLAVLLFLSQRASARREDLLWLGAAVLMATPLAFTGGATGLAFGAAQILGPWLVYAAFRQLHRSDLLATSRTPLAMGLIVGFALLVLEGLAGIRAVHVDTALTIAQAIEWGRPAALYGHTVFVLGALIAALAPDSRLRTASLALAALGVLASGSREAAIAWVLVTAGLWIVGQRRRGQRRIFELLILVAMVAVAVGLGPTLGWGRVGFLVDLAAPGASSNLLQGTEIGQGDWWDPMGVSVRTSPGSVDGVTLQRFTITKTSQEQWRRLQQVVRLVPGQTYTVSAYLKREDAETRPGIQGWGQATNRGFILTAALDGTGWHAGHTGSGHIVSTQDQAVGSGWHRVAVTFVYDGSAPMAWWLGVAPDQQPSVGTSTTFAGFMMEKGDRLGPYQAGHATRGLDLAVGRVPFWQAAWQGFLKRPWVGWGRDAFPTYYRQRIADSERIHEVPSHAHSFFLQELFGRGVVGLAGALLLLSGLCFAAVKRRDLPFLVALSGVLFINVFDNTLLSGGIIYPLAAFAGWQSVAAPTKTSWGDAPRQTWVRLVLAASDLGTGFAALALSVWFHDWLTGAAMRPPITPLTLYALLLWPLMAWREGLYPGYGLTPAQELRKHVNAVTTSVLLVAAARIVLPTSIGVPGSTLALLLTTGVVLSPLGRALAKRLLWAAKAWGRDVIVLGAGDTGSRMARALQRTPLDGLHPVAFFDDDPALQGGHVCGLPVVGPLASADAYAERHGVRHAIVAIPTLAASRLQTMLDRRNPAFDRVQFVPDLAGLPSEDVFASSIDGMLALEVRIGLYNAANRAVKRAWDIAGSVMLLALASPVLLALYLWVRADSRGAGLHASHRIGEGGRPFACLKFRTMHVDAEQRLGELLETDARLRHEYARFHKLTSDPRVTRAGRVLRRLSLDELPQLFNVLRGEMSLVGPRPYLARELPDIGAIQDILFRAKPGMTGYWQVTARNNVTFRDRLQMEAHYVRNWSIWWDIILLTQTPAVVLRRRGAK